MTSPPFDPDASFDVAVVGAGVFGLWIARCAAEAGLRTCVIDRARAGSGASGGVLGALMPHAPERWNAKKQFQLGALLALPDAVAALEDETGMATGYRRTGRIMPVRSEGFAAAAAGRATASRVHWDAARRGLTFEHRDGTGPANWLSPQAAPFGHVADNLSARIAPRAYLAALTAAVASACQLVENFETIAIDSGNGVVHGSLGQRLSAGRIVLTAGHDSFRLLQPFTGRMLGTGVKGEAVLLQTCEDPALPIVYDDGTYVIVHDDGRTAVGSTSRPAWEHADRPDTSDRGFLDRAIELVPRLRGAPVAEWWAGVRPKCHERDPIVGVLPMHPRVVVATGGFKIGFGIAHHVAEVVAAILSGKDVPAMPTSFSVEHHLARAEARAARSGPTASAR